MLTDIQIFLNIWISLWKKGDFFRSKYFSFSFFDFPQLFLILLSRWVLADFSYFIAGSLGLEQYQMNFYIFTYFPEVGHIIIY